MAQLKTSTIYGDLLVTGDVTFREHVYGASLYVEEDASSPYYLRLYTNSGLTANKTLTLNVNNADRTLSMSGNLTVSAAATVSGTNTGDQTSVSGNAGTATTLQTARNIFGVSFNGSANISYGTTAGFARFDANGNFTTVDTNTYSVSTHTHLYAGSASAGGAASSVANALTMNNGGSGAASGSTYNGSAAVTISYNSIGAQPSNSNLTSLAGLTYASASFVKMTGANTFTLDTNTYSLSNHTHSYLPLAGGDLTGKITTSYNSASGLSNFSVAKTVLGAIHVVNGSGTGTTDRKEAAITFMGSSAAEAQAGIYVLNDSFSGTHMGFATTDSYATGPQLAITVTNGGLVNFPRARPTYNGNTILDAANYNDYAPSKTGTGASGSWGISVTGSSASCTGNAATATKLANSRTINGTSFDGTSNITITANTPNSLSLEVSGTGLSGSASFNGSSAVTFTITSNATNANTASTIVARDGSGNFSAGTITATTFSGSGSSLTSLPAGQLTGTIPLAVLKIASGSSTFAGNSTAKTIAHGLGSTPTFVGVTPSANPSGYLGEIWYTADATNISVYNSGSAVTSFTWLAKV